MLEALAQERDRQVRALNTDLAVHGLSLYGLVSVLSEVGAPAGVSSMLFVGLGGAAVYRWLVRRSEVKSLEPAQPRALFNA